MEQKRISFKVAKAIKKAGYPQSICRHWYNERGIEYEWYGDIGELEAIKLESDVIAPTYFDVWCWLWRERKIEIEIYNDGVGLTSQVRIQGRPQFFIKDPEEAIVSAIDYLVDNDLIK